MKKYKEALREWQREYFVLALASCNGSVSKASRLTGVNRTSLYKLLHKTGVDMQRAAPDRKTINRGNKAWQELNDKEHLS